jgi:cell division inhibitor SepF
MSNDVPSGEVEQRGLWSRIKETIGLHEELEEEEEFETGENKPPVTLRLQSARVSYVSVRMPRSFDDARIAADGLKDGRQQIINLENTPQEMSERIIDFLNGVTYALNGFVEKVGDRVYLFAPSNVIIEVPEDLHKSSPTFFDDKP